MADIMSRFLEERLFNIVLTCIVSVPRALWAAPARRLATARRAPPTGTGSETRGYRLNISSPSFVLYHNLSITDRHADLPPSYFLTATIPLTDSRHVGTEKADTVVVATAQSCVAFPANHDLCAVCVASDVRAALAIIFFLVDRRLGWTSVTIFGCVTAIVSGIAPIIPPVAANDPAIIRITSPGVGPGTSGRHVGTAETFLRAWLLRATGA